MHTWKNKKQCQAFLGEKLQAFSCFRVFAEHTVCYYYMLDSTELASQGKRQYISNIRTEGVSFHSFHSFRDVLQRIWNVLDQFMAKIGKKTLAVF